MNKPRILIVDDTPANIKVLSDLLREDYTLSVALSGQAALDLALGDDTRPDLVLLDVMMPEMDGYEVCRRLKADERTCSVPVIFITAMHEVDDEAKGFELGAVDYIAKPVSPPIVRGRVRSAISLRRKTLEQERLVGNLSKYLSPQIVHSLLTGEKGTELVTQRKKLTVFFSDIKDFTKTTENMQPEDLSYLLNSYFTEMPKIALHYGATIDKFIGDAMLMFFGDPETKGVKEDAEACVRMAVAMQRRMRKLQSTWRFRGHKDAFHMRIGINTGYCNVGNFGSEDRMDYTIIGGEVNLAARLEVQADPDGILISAETHALVQDIVKVEQRPSLQAKGIDREVQCYAITGIYDEELGNPDLIRSEYEGLRIIADLETIRDQDRETIADELEQLLARVRREPRAESAGRKG